MSSYDANYFVEEGRVARLAAEAVLPTVLALTQPRKVIDVGCGEAAFAAVARSLGCEVLAVDAFVPAEQVFVPLDEFARCDLREGVDCWGFDLAICTEVGEHLPEEAAGALVAGLCNAKFVLWSAAIPGQGGVDHINCQWPSWWAAFFADHGFIGTRAPFAKFWDDKRIAGFYRQNFILWSTPERLGDLGLDELLGDLTHPEMGFVPR